MNNRIVKIIVFFLLAAGLPGDLYAAAIPVDDTLAVKNICSDVDYIVDDRNTLAPADVMNGKSLKWTRWQSDFIRFGYTKSQLWFRFTVDNRTGKSFSWLCEVDNPTIDLIELYLPDASGRYSARRSGDSLPFSVREVKDVTYLFKVRQEPGPMTCYMHIKSIDSVNFRLNILGNDAYVERMRKDLPLYWVFFGLMLIMVLYNLAFFISWRIIGYFYLTCFIFMYGLFEFMFKGFAAQYLWPGTPWLSMHSAPILINLAIVFLTLFLFDFVQQDKTHKYYRLVLLLLLIVIASSLSTIVVSLIDVRTSLLLGCVIAVCSTAGELIIGIYKGFIDSTNSRQARIVLLAFTPFAVAVPIVILNLVGVLPDSFSTRWSLPIGTSAAIVFLSFSMADKINSMKSMIQMGEIRYRHLVESTDDIIFTLDDNNRIQSINMSVKSHLGYKPDELVGMNFANVILETGDERFNITQQIVLEYISDIKKRKKGSVRFHTPVNHKYSHEPKELMVTLEYKGEGSPGYVILGKASPVVDDALTPFLAAERFEYNLNNFLGNAELMSQRLVRNLGRFMDPAMISDIRIALREAIINAIEHGNLALTFEEKTESQLAGKYFDLVKKRQMDPAFGRKNVYVECSMDAERVKYTISDEGDGFDYQSMIAIDPGSPDNRGLMHGRGLLIITHAFDEVQFDKRGSTIILVKYFKKA
jgi:two-component system, sensor histidine kinase LadS